MAKLLMINKCEDCKYGEYYCVAEHGHQYYCVHSEKIIPDMDKIPEWCELLSVAEEFGSEIVALYSDCQMQR